MAEVSHALCVWDCVHESVMKFLISVNVGFVPAFQYS